ncbi:MAG: hypothetical protein KAT65_26700 [Methanophagales archaeon]|nr:hypothetical protein [Methanophagales archaeon]
MLIWIIPLEIFILFAFLIYWLLTDKYRKKFLARISWSALKSLVDTSLTTVVSMASLSGIILSLLFGFMIGAPHEFVSLFSEDIIWIMIISLILTVSFIGASTFYHMTAYAGPVNETENMKEFEHLIDIFRIGVFFYLLGIFLFLLTITLLVLITMLYFQIGMPFIIIVGLFYIPIAIIILFFVGNPIFRFMKK